MKRVCKIKIFLKKSKIMNYLIMLIKNKILYYYFFKAKLNPIKIQKICFFYLPEVPDFGRKFTYFKLGKKEKLINPEKYSIIFEEDLQINLSSYNEFFMDYSGLYALYMNNLINEKFVILIHYDTKIRHKKWLEIIEAQVKKHNIVYSTWEVDEENSEVAKWVYNKIDKVFLSTHDKTFLSYLKENGFKKLPNSSQFACSKDTFLKLMEFLMPIYDYILKENELTFQYAHLLERAWGLFFSLTNYKVVGVIEDSHSQSYKYAPNVIKKPLLTTAIEKNVSSFSDII